MYSPLTGWIVSLTTIFRTSARTGNEMRATVTMLKMKRDITGVFMFAGRGCIVLCHRMTMLLSLYFAGPV